MRKTRVWLNWMLAMVMLATLLSACSSDKSNTDGSSASPKPSEPSTTAQASDPAPESGIDISKKVELQFYMLGNEPKDLAKIEEEVNKMLLEDLNATVKFNYTTWTDWDQKYKLLLSTGQSIDLIFTADWTQYQSYAKAGAFSPLDELLPAAAPKLFSFVPQDMWDGVKVDGKIYTIPSTYKEYISNGFVWREDLREKYNLPKPVSLETFEQYLDGIKQNEPDIQPLSVNGEVKGNLFDPYSTIAHDPIGAPPYGLGISYNDPSNVHSYWGSEQNLEDLKVFKRWADKGFFPKNVLNIKDSSQDIVSGKAVAQLADNPTRFSDTLRKMQAAHPDWKLEYYPAPFIVGHVSPVHPIHNGFAIPKGSKNPERALAFYEKMVTDKRYNQLTQYGLEGEHYTVEDGYYKSLGDPSNNGFPREGMQGWAWRNPEFMLFDEGYDDVKKIFEELDQIQTPDRFSAFVEDYFSYQAERAALEQVERQYMYPLLAGQVEDIEDGLKTFMEKAKQAGLDKVQEAYKQQWLQYLSEQGIQ